MASEIKVDTVSEKTSGSGVTIDGLLIKDGGISGDVSLIGTTPTFTIGDAGAEDAALVFDGNAQDFYIALDDSADDLVIGLGNAVGTTPMLSFTEGGAATFKNIGTGDDNPMVLTLQTSETDMAANDILGSIRFQAPDEGTGTDAILVAASIDAISEGDFSSSSNATKLSFKTGVSEAASEKMSLSSGGLLTVADDIVFKDGGTIGVSSAVDAMTVSSGGIVTFKDDILIKDGGTIGSASDADSIAIAANGVVTFSQAPVFPDGSLNIADIDLDGGTDIGAAIVDADLFLIDDGAGGTMRKTAASRLKTYIGGGLWDEIAVVTADNSDSNLVAVGMNDSDYEVFMGVMSHMTPGNDGVNLELTLVNASNSAFTSHNYAVLGLDDGGGESRFSGSNSGSPICAGSVGSDTNEDGVSGMVWITRPHLSKMTVMNWNLGYTKDNGKHSVSVGGFSLSSTSGPANGVRIKVSGGNLESGTFKLYGLKA